MNAKIAEWLARAERAGLNLQSVRERITAEEQKPLSAAIFGQTGCGKSSLTNALFGTSFDVDDAKPCTKAPQSFESRDAHGNVITFWDLPGIGESATSDQQYLEMYVRYATSCDVILWAFQADTRSMTLDAHALEVIVKQLSQARRQQFLDRLSVVVTKVDLITPGPWLFGKDGDEVRIASSARIDEVLDRKSRYFYDELLGRHAGEVVHSTFVSSKRKHLATLPRSFWLDETKRFLNHQGSLPKQELERLRQEWPQTVGELTRLYEQSKAVCCSARYRFNLDEVKARVAQKSRGESMLRLSQTIAGTESSLVLSSLADLGLPVFFDWRNQSVIFDVANLSEGNHGKS